MITVRARILIIVGLVLLLVLIVNRVRERRLELKYALAWLLCDSILILFTLFPGLMNGFAGLFGIYAPVNMIFFLGFIFLALIGFSLTVAVSRMSVNQRKLAQISALREYEAERWLDEEGTGKDASWER